LQVGVGQDRGGVAQVGLDDSRVWIVGQQPSAERHGDRVLVYVHHACVRGDVLRDLVHIADGREAGAEVDELPDALAGQEPHGAAQEGAVVSRDEFGVWFQFEELLGQPPVDGEVLAAAPEVVVDLGGAGHVRAGRIAWRRLGLAGGPDGRAVT
jgi:hypothetical protein